MFVDARLKMSAKKDQSQGFTLVDVMIVSAIVAILAAIAIPVYKNYLVSARMTDAFSNLSSLQLKMSNYYQDNRVYGPGDPTCAINVAISNSQYFSYTCQTSNSMQNFTITATGVNAMAGFIYTINDTASPGTTTVPAGWAGNSVSCWVKKPDGSC
jgi:type IV pilus assembly protein PilE